MKRKSTSCVRPGDFALMAEVHPSTITRRIQNEYLFLDEDGLLDLRNLHNREYLIDRWAELRDIALEEKLTAAFRARYGDE